MEISVIVLGDLARSPRMLNHVYSLLSHDCKVNLIGYEDSALPKVLLSNQNLKIFSLRSKTLSSIKFLSGKLFIIYALIRMIIESLQLLIILLRTYKSKVFLIQNPPSMPVLAIAYIVSCIYSTELIID
jgi:hypothetical protein